MRDRQPTKSVTTPLGQALRYDVYGEGSVFLRQEFIIASDEPSEVGTPINKANLLADATETAIWGSIANRTPNAALLELAGRRTAFGACTNSGTALTATLSNAPGWQQTDGALIAITFTSAVAACATLNVASKGAGNIRVGGANITAGVIPAGATATLMRSGTYWLVLAVDSKARERVPVFFGTYTGNGVATRTITTVDELGAAFRPRAVLLFARNGETSMVASSSGGSVAFGGLALDGVPSFDSYSTSTSNIAIEIVEGGFSIRYVPPYTNHTAAGLNPYRYIAFR